MSPNVGNFVHDLVEMAKAMERLPGVEHELEQAHAEKANLLDRIQRLEARAMERSAEIDALHSKVREAEAGRDQAETMFLEESDRTAALRRLAEGFVGSFTTLVKASEPEPVAQPQPVNEPYTDPNAKPWPGQSEPTPTNSYSSDSAASSSSVPVENITGTQGQSDVPFEDHTSSGWNPNIEPAPLSHPSDTEYLHSPAQPAPTSAGLSDAHSEPAQPSDATSTGTAIGDGSGGATEQTIGINEAGQGVSHPTTNAPTDTPQPPATPTEPVVSTDADPEPVKYDESQTVRREWWSWYDRQTGEFRSAYDWSAH
jgi:hypothetical protein